MQNKGSRELKGLKLVHSKIFNFIEVVVFQMDIDDHDYKFRRGWIPNTTMWSNWWMKSAAKFLRKRSAITKPANEPMLTDAQWLDAWPEPDHVPPDKEDMGWRDKQDSHMVRIVQNRHEKKQNMLFSERYNGSLIHQWFENMRARNHSLPERMPLISYLSSTYLLRGREFSETMK